MSIYSKKEPTLSVIVSAYNAEKTLKKCIDSILENNISNIEIIISNDGSTDKTQDIINDYVLLYPFISFVRDNNGGLSCARNRGISVASGRYITFVDSDDFVEPGIYDKIVDVLSKHKPDMLEYQYWVSIHGSKYAATKNQLEKDTVLGSNILHDTIIPVALNIYEGKEFFIGNFVWNKVYKAEYINSHQIRFDETRRKWEDRLFTLTYLQYAQTYYSMSEYGYHYVCDGNQSLSGRFEPGILRIIMDSYRKYVDMYGDRYSFNNPYTTNYFCSLLTSVAQDQFAYEVDENILKAMFAIFKEDHMIRELFTRWKVDDVNKCTIRSVILNGSIDDVYMLFYQQARKKHRHERCKFACGRIRHHISRIKRAIFHKK